MKAIVIFAVAFLLHNSEATFGGPKASGNFALSGNFHGLLGNHGASKPSEPAPAPVEPEPVPPTPVEPSPSPSSGFNLGGNLHGLLKNHRLLSSFHGNKESQSGSGFSFGGNIQGLLKNHRLLSTFHKKDTTTASSIDLGFDDNNEGYSVSTGDIAPEPIEVVPPPVEIPEPVEVIPEPVVTIPEQSVITAPQTATNNVVTGSASFSSSGGHNVHKILGDVVGVKVRILQQAQNGINKHFDNHIRNFEKLVTKFNNKGQSGSGSSFHGGFSLHGNRN